ncbi:MAG: SAM-dependent DNA methyltransferase, partial [Candidatus Lokiarchaeota archaeon]|nr:SAM-dependent DNA methyltransferase [Candidatus Lokiarchaeota archaeon]
MGVVEDSINDLIREHLKGHGIDITKKTVSIKGMTFTPDFRLVNGVSYWGEGEWERTKLKGIEQAQIYYDDPHSNGAFLILYPGRLQKEIATREADHEIKDVELKSILEGESFQIYFKLRSTPKPEHAFVAYPDLPAYFKEKLEKKTIDSIDIESLIKEIKELEASLKELLPSVNKSTARLFRTILGYTDDMKNFALENEGVAKNAASYIFLDQLIFYHLLSHHNPKKYPPMNVSAITSKDDVKFYFLKVLEFDFRPVFSIDILKFIAPERIEAVKNLISAIIFFAPQYFDKDLLGRLFHKLIPMEVRREVAAYYTMPTSAELLAGLAIQDYNINLIDPACGSGAILVASYQRLRYLYEKEHCPITDEVHQKLLRENITGTDIMPFSAHLSLINLSIQKLDVESPVFRIALMDSTRLQKSKEIVALHALFRHAQSSLMDFTKTDKNTSAGQSDKTDFDSITLDGKKGEAFKIEKLNLVIMNPPFTRQELINKLVQKKKKTSALDDYKKLVINNIATGKKEYLPILNEKLPFSSYFVILADKLLDEGGIIAAVLPATILRTESNLELRKYLVANYSINYIVARNDALNFSDDTTLKEILFILTKKKPVDDHAVCYVTLNHLKSGMTIDIQTEATRVDADAHVYRFEDFNIQKRLQKDLDPGNLFGPISLNSIHLQNILNDVLKGKMLKPLREFEQVIERSGRSVITREGAASRHHAKLPQ